MGRVTRVSEKEFKFYVDLIKDQSFKKPEKGDVFLYDGHDAYTVEEVEVVDDEPEFAFKVTVE